MEIVRENLVTIVDGFEQHWLSGIVDKSINYQMKFGGTMGCRSWYYFEEIHASGTCSPPVGATGWPSSRIVEGLQWMASFKDWRELMCFLLIVDGLHTFDMLHSSTGNFLLIVDGLHTFDVLPSSTGNFPLIVDGLQIFDVSSRRSA
ncbi:hypothetical protein TNCV_3040191 [Trichonephila clavipes]|nr:hypothetical protein TNCV_3040191 [Trichonephila clavipes]